MAFPRVRGPYGKNVTSEPSPVLSLRVHVLCPHHRVSRPLLMRRISQSHLEGRGVGVSSEKEMDFQAEQKRERDFHMKRTSTQAKGWPAVPTSTSLAVPASTSLAVPPASTQLLCDFFGTHVHWNVCGVPCIVWRIHPLNSSLFPPNSTVLESIFQSRLPPPLGLSHSIYQDFLVDSIPAATVTGLMVPWMSLPCCQRLY